MFWEGLPCCGNSLCGTPGAASLAGVARSAVSADVWRRRGSTVCPVQKWPTQLDTGSSSAPAADPGLVPWALFPCRRLRNSHCSRASRKQMRQAS